MASIIEIRNMHKSFGNNEVLKGVSLNVNKGEVIGIIGASGSGKSTMIRCIAGLETIESGEISLKGKVINDSSNVVGIIGMVFQNFNLFPHYNVIENITKPLTIVKKLSEEEAKRKAILLLKKVKLEEQKDQYPSTLSGGQKQRLAIARALAMDPEILVFDEPTSSLDPELAHEVFQTINNLAEEGQTMLIVTHQINALRKFSTRIVFLKDGVIEVDDKPEIVFNNNENENLRDFLKMVEFNDI